MWSVLGCVALVVAMLAGGGCRHAAMLSFAAADDAAAREEGNALFAEFGGEEMFINLTHYLYRWYLDEMDISRADRELRHQLWLRRVEVEGDADDRSQFMEVVLPAIKVAVLLKRTDYKIPELELNVKSDGYRIVKVCREEGCGHQLLAKDYVVKELDLDLLFEHLFETRLDRVFPDAELLARIKESAADEIAALREEFPELRGGTVYFAPVNPIANEIWCFWVDGKVLFHFSSDIDLLNQRLWDQDTLDVMMYNVLEQTVVSHDERPGDDRFITRDQVGRALYNCVVLGKRIALPARER